MELDKEPLVPNKIWLSNEDIDWRNMPKSDLRDKLKTETFKKLYTPGAKPPTFLDDNHGD